MLNSQPLNTNTFNYGVTPAATEGVVTYSDTSLEPYRLQLHNPAGDLLYVLNGWTDAVWERKVNEPEVLSFTHSVQDDAELGQEWSGLLNNLVYPNFVYIFEGDSTSSKQRFRIMETEYTEDVGGVIRVQAYSILEQLGREFVGNYSTQGEADETDPGKTVTQVVQALLAGQTQGVTVSLRTITAGVGNQVFKGKFENKTIWQCLKDLLAIYGGYITTDNNFRLTWSSYNATNEGHRVDLNLNAIQIRKRVDYSDLANVVYVAGAGTNNATRILVSAMDSASVATYGEIGTFIKDQSITSTDAANELAEKELERRKQPRIYYDVDAIDLSKVQNGEDFAYEANAFTIGKKLRIIGREIEFDTHVQSIEIDLMNPAGVRIQVANPQVGEGLAGLDSVGSTDDDSIEEIVAEIAEIIDGLQGDRGELESVRKSLDPIPDDLTAIVTWDETADEGSLPDKLVDLLDVPYAELPGPQDAIIQTLVDAITNDRGGLVEAIETASPTFSLVEATDRDALNAAMTDGQLGRTTGDSKVVYASIDGRERPLQIIRSSNISALESILKSNELGSTDDTGKLIWCNNFRNEQVATLKTADNKELLEDILFEGEIGSTTGTTKRFYVRINATIVCISHLE